MKEVGQARGSGGRRGRWWWWWCYFGVVMCGVGYSSGVGVVFLKGKG